MRAPIRLGLQLPNFNLPEVSEEQLFERLSDIATTAESSGFDSLFVMDHLHQIPGVGPPENWMLEGNTILAALAARTSRVNLGLLVGGVTYRNPALMAKIATTLDVISEGRAILGIGAAWFEQEHVAYGFDFPPLGERFERLEDTLQIFRGMLTAGNDDDRRPPPQRAGGHEQPAPDPGRHPDHDRRQRRAQDAAHGGPVRRRVATSSATPSASAIWSACSRITASDSAATLRRSPRRGWARW